MSPTAERVLHDALSLPEDERVRLAEELLASVDKGSEARLLWRGPPRSCVARRMRSPVAASPATGGKHWPTSSEGLDAAMKPHRAIRRHAGVATRVTHGVAFASQRE
jgi:hypothetical protein